MLRTSNPILNDRTFGPQTAGSLAGVDRMTIEGVVHKTGFLTLLALLSACLPWWMFFNSAAPGGVGNPGVAMPIAIAGALGGLVVALILAFKPMWAPILAPPYALLEGLFLGGISAYYQSLYKGIVVQAAALTLMVLGVMLVIYRTRIIKVTNNLRIAIMAATGAIALVYLVSIVLSFFGTRIPMIHEGGVVGIGFSLLVVGIAAFNLVLDFDFIERGADNGAPKKMEWFAAFGLLVTIVWLYIEMLRLLSKIRRD